MNVIFEEPVAASVVPPEARVSKLGRLMIALKLAKDGKTADRALIVIAVLAIILAAAFPFLIGAA